MILIIGGEKIYVLILQRKIYNFEFKDENVLTLLDLVNIFCGLISGSNQYFIHCIGFFIRRINDFLKMFCIVLF